MILYQPKLEEVASQLVELTNGYATSIENKNFRYETAKGFIHALIDIISDNSDVDDKLKYKLTIMTLDIVNGLSNINYNVVDKACALFGEQYSKSLKSSYEFLNGLEYLIRNAAENITEPTMLCLRIATYGLEERVLNNNPVIPKYWEHSYEGIVEAERLHDCEDLINKLYAVYMKLKDYVNVTGIESMYESQPKLQNALILLQSFEEYVGSLYVRPSKE